MTPTLKPYPKMKESSVPWLGPIPFDWPIQRLKNISNVIMGQSPPSNACNTSVSGLPFLQGCAEFGERHPTPKQYCPDPPKFSPANAVLVSVRAPVGRLNRADQPYGIGRGLCAISAIRTLCDSSFVQYYLEVSSSGLAMSSTGSTYDAVSVGDVASLPVPVPSLVEQTAIARFLDHMDRRIQKYIRAKEKLIALLDEYKQALIHQAVTGQIDVRTGEPYGEYKESGVEWLGRVPGHWDVFRVKQAAATLRGKFTHRPRNDPAFYDGPYPFIQTGDVARAEKEITEYTQTLNHRGLAVSQMFPAGTLVMAIAANIGDVALLDFEACFPDSVVGFVPREAVERDFVFRVFQAMKSELIREAPVNTQGNLNVDRIGSRTIPIPPETEQLGIVQYLQSISDLIDATTKAAHDQALLSREYRTRLIADVVTGKLDVREAAAGLRETDSPVAEPREA